MDLKVIGVRTNVTRWNHTDRFHLARPTPEGDKTLCGKFVDGFAWVLQSYAPYTVEDIKRGTVKPYHEACAHCGKKASKP